MTNTAPTNADDRTPDDQQRSDDWTLDAEETRESPERTADLTAVVTEDESGPDECTIYPREAGDEELVTRWITAEEGSYVELDEVR